MLAEGVAWLACFLEYHATPSTHCITPVQSVQAARLFLYYHNAFHHRAECFATRMELSARTRIYVDGMIPLYGRGCKAGDCLEETVAKATGICDAREKLRGGSIEPVLV